MSNGTTTGPRPAATSSVSGAGETGGWHVLVASNRGPVSFVRDDDGALRSRPERGELASAVSALPVPDGALWVCAALSDSDRSAARSTTDGQLEFAKEGGTPCAAHRVRMLDIEALTFSRAEGGVANSVLWYVHHMLCDTARSPLFGMRFRREWASYVDYNQTFADALAEDAAPGARVVVHDYHLTLVPQLLREQRPDLAIAYFSHTPWAPPDYFRLLPDDVAVAVLEGILAADHVGFLTARWKRAFLHCCEDVLDATVDYTECVVEYAGRETRVGVHPLGVDADWLRSRADRSDVHARMTTLRGLVGGRRLILRVDRTELSKNTLRGLLAYRELLRKHPEWHGRVVHFAFVHPGRFDLPEYQEYTADIQRAARKILDEFGSPDWEPLVLAVDDDLARSLAAYRMADVAVVNPVRDGMNSVAKEIPVVSDHGCALVLSRDAGAAAELGSDALLVNPYDVEATADALHEALTLTGEDRQKRCARLAAAAGSCPPGRWLASQLAALGVDPSS